MKSPKGAVNNRAFFLLYKTGGATVSSPAANRVQYLGGTGAAPGPTYSSGGGGQYKMSHTYAVPFAIRMLTSQELFLCYVPILFFKWRPSPTIVRSPLAFECDIPWGKSL